MPGDKSADPGREIVLEGFRVRHLVDVQSADWPSVNAFLNWLELNDAQVVSVTLRRQTDRLFDLSLAVEMLSASTLREYFQASPVLKLQRLEHLFVRDGQKDAS